MELAPKPYRIKARIQNNRLWTAILARFPWVRTQADAAKVLGVDQQGLGIFLNMRVWPYNARRKRWWRTALKVCDALFADPEEIFDPVLYGRKANPIEVEIGVPELIASGLLQLPPAPDEFVVMHELQEAVGKAIGELRPREREVLEARFGLNGTPEKTLEEIGEQLGVSKEMARVIEAQALRKLRHPERAKYLKPFVGPDGR
jgi:RNA polymerase sigma factor (sigma-70 family)